MGLLDFLKQKGEASRSKPSISPALTQLEEWDEAASEDLRETIRNMALGEVRLNRSDPGEILEACREVHIEDQAPESLWPEFLRFAAAQIKDAASAHAQEQKLWPQETDCDRLDRVEEELRKNGILFWQVSPCCDTCSSAELPDQIDAIEEIQTGFRETVRGYSFYIEQNLADMLVDGTQISLYLAYGWLRPESSELGQDEYEARALGIAGEVRDCLTGHGLEVKWNGELSQKIGVSVNWQRRTRIGQDGEGRAT
jgi:hypothetical protein